MQNVLHAGKLLYPVNCLQMLHDFIFKTVAFVTVYMARNTTDVDPVILLAELNLSDHISV